MYAHDAGYQDIIINNVPCTPVSAAGINRSLVVKGLSVILTLQSKFLDRVRSYVDL